jgi:glutathione synthase/RimK-type ligase-like ATP-grasp enzyme
MAMTTLDDRPIVLVGGTDDRELHAVLEHLVTLGEQPLVLDPRVFPADLKLSLAAERPAIEIDGRLVPLPRSVYLRSLHADPVGFATDVDRAMEKDWRRTSMMLRERATLLSAVLLRWSSLGVRVYNSLESQQNITKPHQLALLEASGLPVPATLWSNDPARVREFCTARPAIYKPVTGGAATRRVQEDDLSDARLARLASAPVCFQELLPGHDVRVYVIDGEALCALRIEAREIDFRGSEERIEAVALPQHVLHQCVQAARLLGLRFTGIDLREDATGVLRFLELNPAPMFVGFEQWAGVEIGAALCHRLALQDRPRRRPTPRSAAASRDPGFATVPSPGSRVTPS